MVCSCAVVFWRDLICIELIEVKISNIDSVGVWMIVENYQFIIDKNYIYTYLVSAQFWFSPHHFTFSHFVKMTMAAAAEVQE